MANELMDFDAARALLLQQAIPVSGQVQVPLLSALGRVLAQDIISGLDVPGFDNSAMDGYALNVPDFLDLPTEFPLVQRIAAGEVGAALSPGAAARIFTGAPVPPGTNAVVMQEDCQVNDNRVRIAALLKAGQHIRRQGEDIRQGMVIFPAGHIVSPQDMALIASVGLPVVPVYEKLKVGLLCTGDELFMPGETLPPGGIYNSNQFALHGLLTALGCEVNNYGIVPDSLSRTSELLAQAAQENHLILTSGGVSVGEEDHVKAAITALGQLHLWKIAIKPGKPFAFGAIGPAAFIGLPGNPVSSFITFLMLVRPFILKCQGVQSVLPQSLSLPAGFVWQKGGSRREFLRARLNIEGKVDLFPQQGSAVMTSVVWANGLVDMAPGETVKMGDPVHFIPFSALGV